MQKTISNNSTNELWQLAVLVEECGLVFKQFRKKNYNQVSRHDIKCRMNDLASPCE